jgi:hypothetical protein
MLPIENNRPMGENSPNLVTLAEKGTKSLLRLEREEEDRKEEEEKKLKLQFRLFSISKISKSNL